MAVLAALLLGLLTGVRASSNDCGSVAVIGDSLTEQSAGELATVLAGVRHVVDGRGGRRTAVSYVRTDPPVGYTPSGVEAVRGVSWRPDCWVIALGTNDVLRGDPQTFDADIRTLLDAIPSGRVLWVSVGPQVKLWTDVWNRALVRAGVELVRWEPDSEWLKPDGIHVTAVGARERARLIGRAVGQASAAAS